MIQKGMTINGATQRWVAEFNSFPQDMISKLMDIDIDSWHEVTKPACGNRVTVITGDFIWEDGEIEAYDGETELYIISLDKGEQIQLDEDEFEVERDYGLPMWGTMWNFKDSCDVNWLEDEDGIRAMSECGFMIYEHDEWGYFFGINGAGYDFYEMHWIPLYKARKLQWHDPKTEEKTA